MTALALHPLDAIYSRLLRAVIRERRAMPLRELAVADGPLLIRPCRYRQPDGLQL